VKIVCISDTHEWHSGEFEVPDGDILLHAGDFTFEGKYAKISQFNHWLGTLPHKHKIVIPGNHDLTFDPVTCLGGTLIAEDLITNAELLIHESIEVEGLKIYGEPSTPWFYDWAFNVQRGEGMKAIWDQVPEDTDVLLTHGPPYMHGDLTKGFRGGPPERVGCHDQLDLIKRLNLKMVVCGHIHSAYGVHACGDTLVVNASTCNEKYKPINPPVVINL
jgi:Icc-related predicted phosphoesterase